MYEYMSFLYVYDIAKINNIFRMNKENALFLI